VAIAAIIASELLQCVDRAAVPGVHPGRAAEPVAVVEGLLTAIPILPFDLVVARIHRAAVGPARGQGRVGRRPHLLIAVTAIAAGHRVATRGERTFPRIPGLATVRW
jgi:predicted nucleic acid-binding protein